MLKIDKFNEQNDHFAKRQKKKKSFIKSKCKKELFITNNHAIINGAKWFVLHF